MVVLCLHLCVLGSFSPCIAERQQGGHQTGKGQFLELHCQ
jgi:hypothetical protein